MNVQSKEPMTEAETWKYAEKAMTWYGWGSPVGLGLFVVEIAAVAALIRYAFWS